MDRAAKSKKSAHRWGERTRHGNEQRRPHQLSLLWSDVLCGNGRVASRYEASSTTANRRTVEKSGLSSRAAKFSDLAAKAFAVVVLFLSTGGLIQLLFYPTGASNVVNDVEGDPVTQLMWLGLYMITLILVLARWKSFVYVATRDKALLLLFGIVVVSILWSAAPE